MSKGFVTPSNFSFNSPCKIWTEILTTRGYKLSSAKVKREVHGTSVNPLTAEWALKALIDFTLSNARRFYSSMGNPLAGKGLTGVRHGNISCNLSGNCAVTDAA